MLALPAFWSAFIVALSAPCVVVDAGHGGIEHGTTHETFKEKDIALSLAQRVRDALHKRSPELTVWMTRTADVTLGLKERADLVQEKKCVALISMHVNANLDNKLSGVETYYLDTLKARLTEKLSLLRERQQGHKPDEAELIVSDLVARRQASFSGELAVRVLREVMGRLRQQYQDVHSNGARHDLLELLAAVEVPAIIVEAGYISNAGERARLLDKQYQERIAEGVAEALLAFLREHPEA